MPGLGLASFLRMMKEEEEEKEERKKKGRSNKIKHWT